MHRFVLPFFCQREGAEVHGDAACGTKVTVRLHRFVRTGVLVGREPAGLVSANRQQGQPEGAEGRAAGGKMRAVTGIAGEIDRATRRGDHIGHPQAAVALPRAETAAGPVLGALPVHRDAFIEGVGLPPVQRHDIAQPFVAQPRVTMKRG